MKQLLYISWFLILTAAHSLLFAHNTPPSYDTPSVDRGIWKEVHIIYDQDFPYKQNYNRQNIKGCKKTYISSASNNKTETKKIVSVLRCVEHIELLRPDKTVRQWMQIQHKKNFFPLTISTFNFTNIHAQITAIYPVKSDSQQHFLYNKKTKKVTGQFERHTINIKKYTFRNMETGKITTVNATPEHPVYVKNRAIFVPMDLLLTTDHLLSSADQEIRLICRGNRMQHCGESLHDSIPLPVYNLEINHNHTYFVSDIRLLVHNICDLAKKLLEKVPKLVLYRTPQKEREYLLFLQTHEDVKLAFAALRSIEGNKVESDSHVILAGAQHCHSPIQISRLEWFLQKRKSLIWHSYDRAMIQLIQDTPYARPFILLEVETEMAFGILLQEAKKNRIIVMTDRGCSLIFTTKAGKPMLEMLQEKEVEIRRYFLPTNTYEASSLASTYKYGQPLQYFALKPPPGCLDVEPSS